MDMKTEIRTQQRPRWHKPHRSRLRRLQDEVQALKLQLAQIQARQEAQENLAPPANPQTPDRNARLIALLDAFEQGDAEQQRQDFAALQAGVEEARPGQRRVFSEGFNP